MRIRPFDYLAPATLAEAAEALAQAGGKAMVLAGGTDLVLAMKKGLALPETVIGLGSVPGLDGLKEEDGRLKIGPLARHADLTLNPVINDKAPALARAVGLIGSWQIRQAATLGGNICHASPAADSAGPLLALQAEVKTYRHEGGRSIPIAEFFTGPGQTCLAPGELVDAIEVPAPQGPFAQTYLKLMRKKAVDLALIGVSVCLEAEEGGGKLTKIGLALGGVAPTPIRAGRAEALLSGLSPDQALAKAAEAGRLAAEDCRPISDVRASAAYRKKMVAVFVRRGLETALNQLLGRTDKGGAQ